MISSRSSSTNEVNDATQPPKDPVKRTVLRIIDYLRYPMALVAVNAMAIKPRIQSFYKPDKVIKETKFESGRVLLIALWEKGKIRRDVHELILEARRQGAYVIAINTSTLRRNEQLDSIDTYIERFNHGRDFGSYKSGIKWLERNGVLDKADRLVMLNDSIYFSVKGREEFVSGLLFSELDVTGATENYEIKPHFGSFALSMSSHVLRHPRFRKYWKFYRNSDIRPKVINNGELKLSAVLRRCISSNDSIDILMGVNNVARWMRENDDNINVAFRSLIYGRAKWRTVTMKSVFEIWRKRNMYVATMNEAEIKLQSGGALTEYLPISNNLDQALVQLWDIFPGIDRELARFELRTIAIGQVLSTVVSGSQIHQAGMLFYELGLCIIKMDVVWRGAWNYEDVERFLEKVPEEEQSEMRHLLFERGAGEDMLRGWRRSAFMHGLI